MEVFLYNSTVCRLCAEENDNGTFLYSIEENNQNLSDIINSYLPIKVSDDGELPRTICPGCTIQLEATVEFMNLIINGQKVIRELHYREKEYKKTILTSEQEAEKTAFEANTSDIVYQDDHPAVLQMAGIDKPKRKRGRPPIKHKSPEELAEEAAAREQQMKAKVKTDTDDDVSGKRKRKAPTRFHEVVQGKELEQIFIAEGVIDEESEPEIKTEIDVQPAPTAPKEPEVIGHKEDSGEPVVVVKGKGRGRPKGRMRPTREQCAICGMEFSCVGRYMSHVAQHGRVRYQCGQCCRTFDTRLLFTRHQQDLAHRGQRIIPGKSDLADCEGGTEGPSELAPVVPAKNEDRPIDPLPDINPELIGDPDRDVSVKSDRSIPVDIKSSSSIDRKVENGEAAADILEDKSEEEEEVETAKGKLKLKCKFCDKLFSSRQSKSLHTKAIHFGERPYGCEECGAQFGYPRSLALHALSHRRHKPDANGYACDLCGKVLNHPSSVVYHKEAEHAGHKYVCNKCGKLFKHKQLLQRHQLVHSQLRPYTCKICESTFKTKANLLNHQLLHSGVKKFTCEICKQKFAHKTSLTLHMRWHTGHKPYSCSICGKSFSQKGNLSEHERIHTGEKPFQCSVCPRRFTTSSQHRLHARRHAAEKPYACTHCAKRFSSRGSWAAHARREAAAGAAAVAVVGAAGVGAGVGAVAGGGREHRCGSCGRGFSQRWALARHLRRHTGERPFRCPSCPRTFADCSNLNKHKKHMHKQVSLLATGERRAALAADPQPPSLGPLELQLAAAEPVETLTVMEPADDEPERIIYVAYEPDVHVLAHQAEDGEEGKAPAPALFAGESLLAPLDARAHVPVTDEQGNPLHFTMQDGTRLAITSSDGKSLEVITEDGQTIPVEINGLFEAEEMDNPDTIVHQLNLQKSVEMDTTMTTTHYYTIV